MEELEMLWKHESFWESIKRKKILENHYYHYYHYFFFPIIKTKFSINLLVLQPGTSLQYNSTITHISSQS